MLWHDINLSNPWIISGCQHNQLHVLFVLCIILENLYDRTKYVEGLRPRRSQTNMCQSKYIHLRYATISMEPIPVLMFQVSGITSIRLQNKPQQ